MATAEVIKWTRGLLLINLVAYLILAATGAWLIGGAIDAGYWTAASGFANVFATVAGLVGGAAALSGLLHVRAWSQGSLPAAAQTGFMALLLTLLALGLAIKEIIMGATVHDYKLGSTPIFLGDRVYLAFAVSRALLMGVVSLGQLRYLETIFSTTT